MAFPATGGTKEHLDDVLARTRSLARNVKNHANEIRTASAAGPIAARRIVTMADSFAQINAQFNTLKAAQGLGAYAKSQYDDAAFDIVAEFNAMQTALAGVIAWVVANIPKDSASNRWLAVEELVNGIRTDRTFTSAATAPLRTQLDALIAAID